VGLDPGNRKDSGNDKRGPGLTANGNPRRVWSAAGDRGV